MSSIEEAVAAAVEAYQPVNDDDRGRLIAALQAYHQVLHPLHATAASTAPFTTADEAARWLAETCAHPRYEGTMWKTLLHRGHDLTLATTALRTRRGLPPEAATVWVREAERLIAEHQGSQG